MVAYQKVDVDGIGVFYRAAGPKDAPTILLLHGFPTASHMFRELIKGNIGDQTTVLVATWTWRMASASPLPEKFSDDCRNLLRMSFEREVPRVEETNDRSGNVAFERLGAPRHKEGIAIWCKRFSVNFGAAALRPTEASQNQ